MAKLSIIIPVYQVKSYLDRCLKSILSQTYSDYEVILVDDGSTDGSQHICDNYAEQFEFIKVIHKPNGGLSSARNAGIDISTGNYLMFVDSDDMIHSQTAELEISLLEKNNADAVICPLTRFQSNDEVDIYSSLQNLNNTTVVSGLEAEKGYFNNQNVNKYVSSCGRLYKRNLFDGIRFPVGRLFEDEYTTYKLYYKCSKIVVMDTPLYYYFINESGITQNLNLNKRFDEYDAKEERIYFFKKHKLTELYHLTLLEFLRIAQWDLISYQEGKQLYDITRGAKFQAQYTSALEQAEHEKLISFEKNYDYYVLAYPEKRLTLRLKRMVYKTIGKMN